MMNDLNDLLDSAFDDYNRGDYPSAEQKARDALIISPSHGDCFYLLGLIAYKKGIFTQACDLLNLAVKTYPEQKNYRLALAEVYQTHGDYDKALKIYELFHDNPLVKVNLGWISLNQGKKEHAKSIFKKLIHNQYPDKAYRGLAFCYQNKLKIKYLKKAFLINKSPEIAEDIVRFYLFHHQASRAKKYIYLIQNDLLKAEYLMAVKKCLLAEDLLKNYTLKNPYDIDGIILLASCCENLKKYSDAEKFYIQALSLDKNDFKSHQGIARLMMRQGKLALALDHYQILCRMNPEDKETLLAMALIQEGLGDEAEALGIYFRLLTLKCKGLTSKIKKCIQKLSEKEPQLAKKFVQGWNKNYPKNKTASKMLKNLLAFLLILVGIFQARADYFSDEKNWDLAWKNKMVQFGHAESQYELAEMFETGSGVPKDISQAIHYYQLSAAQDYFPAMLKLGKIFNQNNSYHDADKSLQWYTYAAQKDEVQAQLYLANYYQETEHYDKNLAKYWLEKALHHLFPDVSDLSLVSPDYKKLSS